MQHAHGPQTQSVQFRRILPNQLVPREFEQRFKSAIDVHVAAARVEQRNPHGAGLEDDPERLLGLGSLLKLALDLLVRFSQLGRTLGNHQVQIRHPGFRLPA